MNYFARACTYIPVICLLLLFCILLSLTLQSSFICSLVGLLSDNPGLACPDLEAWTEEVEPTAEDRAYFQDIVN